ncbi:MAG: murein transglycosylase A [Alphaproteobacteria bacterium]|nr:murein transglycosylase A [Alphaproteobacteria bacterium]MBT4084963.1 murein transglycosylase A [Alphaproteobacteria bacterium]MBT4545511.1 murein transglycosylase A [Alphaproteobacteria bacterium]MBT6386434.1 murein transglycosylase A [Alphaproteobacteria bacterium]MBT7746920.1 murein transglycosylase A [Alphaproteobacteria bacterium]
MKSNSNLVALILALVLILAGAVLHIFRPAPIRDGLALQKAEFSDLRGWQQDRHAKSLVAFQKTCARFLKRPADRSLGAKGIAGKISDWQPLCQQAIEIKPDDDPAARQFFETWFTPMQARNGEQETGMFTGYYEPLLRGSLKQKGPYQTALLARPDDLITVELRDFRSDLSGRRIAGRLLSGKLKPYPERKKIVAGGLADEAKPLVWVDDKVSAFFLQIQGSGRVALEDGGEMRVGYAATNGQPYTAIGRELIRRGAVTKKTVSLQSIRDWLNKNPDEAGDVMSLNKSFVFFRELKGDGPIGAQSVALTPGRSLAVDRKFIPLGVPIWLDALAPAEKIEQPDWKLQRLLIAQDTGGAIRGPVRGDVFWGFGERAEQIAGRMKHQGRYFLLLPKTVARRIEATGERN